MSFFRAVARIPSLQQLTAVHAIRVAPSSLRAFHIYQQRQFSSTPRKQATSSPNLDAFSASALNSPLFKELAAKPEVLQSMKDLIGVMQQEGISIDPSNPPSTMKLLMNSRIRSQLMETWQVLQAAGIDQQKLKDAFMLMKPKDS
ncbi:hypothetical protein EIP91_003257 [Steccherinum ochraceum]|uniref:Uncharacterized protein n=1 Tax=Steccherinum ochraceum TaxID=92696 RepID=A0A4R0RRR1_9APHY|nr:hypothetical protein EIP91_003257 [Steccherinum ochraceum]